jgi:hypothetical protein
MAGLQPLHSSAAICLRLGASGSGKCASRVLESTLPTPTQQLATLTVSRINWASLSSRSASRFSNQRICSSMLWCTIEPVGLGQQAGGAEKASRRPGMTIAPAIPASTSALATAFPNSPLLFANHKISQLQLSPQLPTSYLNIS